MKKTLLNMLLVGIAFSGVSVFAQTDTDVVIPESPSVTTVSPVFEKEDRMILSRLSRIQTYGETLIKTRINSLNSNISVISADKSLTADQKTSLTTILNTNITGLTALNTSIASGTDATSTKALVSSIFTQFRVYGVLIPQIRLEKRIYDLQNHSGKLTALFSTVQTKIDEAKGKGKDVTVWQKSLDDAKTLVVKDTTTLATLMTNVSVLKPSDYGTTSKMVIESTNTTIKAILKDFNSIKKNLHRPEVMSSRKIVGGGTNTTSPLFGTSWVWTSSTNGNTVVPAPAGGRFVLSFGEDNHVHSTTDCNGIGGNYTLADNAGISFGSFMSTMMFCEGSHEHEYSQALTSATSYKIDGSKLILTNASGTMMFTRKM